MSAFPPRSVHRRGPLEPRIDGDGPIPLLLAQSVCGDPDEWDAFVGAVGPDYRCIRFDYAGLGAVEPVSWSPERYRTLHGHADDVVALLDALDVEHAVAVGHAIGGHIVTLAHVAAPERIGAVLCMATAPTSVADRADRDGVLSRAEAEALLAAAAQDVDAWASGLRDVCQHRAIDARLPDRRLAARLGNRRPDVAAVTLRAILGADLRPVLPRVACPTLVLQGLWDPQVPATTARALARCLPDAELVLLPTASHRPHVDEVEASRIALTRLVRRLGREAP